MRDFRVVRTGEGESDWEVRLMDDIGLFLDRWLIVRKDGTAVLNGHPNTFEKQLRGLIEECSIISNSSAR